MAKFVLDLHQWYGVTVDFIVRR